MYLDKKAIALINAPKSCGECCFQKGLTVYGYACGIARIWNHKVMFPVHVAAIKLPDCGTCSVIWDCADGYEHVSVSPQKRYNVPTWNDMCTLKDIFFDDEEEAYQIHPKKSQYVNGVENCLHLWKPIGHEIDELVTK